ncbi:MAG: hypothetical protein CLLPBCKN_003144 [Chroococcidiopsis cubana SAG 39.79]|jgi:hypothetical protein|uniref:Uncharacterized protein n=3 Tax=Chroococcidiopsis TaxID=54298 RepID=K9TUH2_CHRTP|nr:MULTISPECIES: hypothetical protein [Chroococcidiopsis]PSB47199.1 hypothetical protein C7B80_10565 [Cyanosarcina cf. burmensis CCALA 770]AFY86487.1 hypothetical protein Chro_0953 [Chroococcidiopsis thermalis PCC 7203]MDZ4873748.1 hypothetical protein [Chroococcidiopsis cubana SAG 39.79]PSB65807.1 hypothetical protein C7B79_03810 [Chroococcidiopsis cubana CCALA 043]RUT13576.1 hypothetical protein DSM107010_11990 [Chroococcidiopsis cubana SAG 39.79]
MKDLSKWLNPRAAIGSLLSVIVLLSVAGGLVSCTPSGDERVRDTNENVEEDNENEADDEDDGNEAPNQNNQDDDD